jgi:hypothetical protein
MAFCYIFKQCTESGIQSIYVSGGVVEGERFLQICLNGVTHTCMMHRWNEENKPHRNKDVVVMYCGHVFFKLGSKVKI